MQHHALGTGKCRSWEYILWILSSLMYDLDLPGMSSSGTQSTLYGAISYDGVELQICNRSPVVSLDLHSSLLNLTLARSGSTIQHLWSS